MIALVKAALSFVTAVAKLIYAGLLKKAGADEARESDRHQAEADEDKGRKAGQKADGSDDDDPFLRKDP